MKKIVSLIFCLLTFSATAFADGSLRGVNVNALEFNSSDEAHLDDLISEGLNFIRLYYFNDNAETQSVAEYEDWFTNTVLPSMVDDIPFFVTQKGLKVLVSIHTPPGGRVSSTPPVDPVLTPGAQHDAKRDLLVSMWTQIATLYNSYGDSLSYQLFSEPATPSGDTSAWETLQGNLIDAIRDATPGIADGNQPAICYMTLFGNPKLLNAINTSAQRGNACLLFNMYFPFNYTHQLTPAVSSQKTLRWPGCAVAKSNGKFSKPTKKKAKKCTRGGISKELKKILAYAEKNNLTLNVAETSVSRRAGNPDRYMKDVYKIFGKKDIGSTYFTLTERGNSPWNLYCAEPQQATCIAGESKVLDVLKQYVAGSL